MLTNAARLALIALAVSALTVLVPAGGADAAGIPCQRTYSNTQSMQLPNPGASVIDVPEDGLVVADVDVLLNIHFTFDAEMSVILVSSPDVGPDHGSSSLVANEGGPSGANMLGTVLDDSATTAISAGSAPFTGRFRPETPLSSVAGYAGGRYSLLFSDGIQVGTGTLDNWSLTFRYLSCDFDHDGVEDHHDSCLSLAGSTVSGCPLASRAVTAKYRHGKFKGWLTSSAPACRSHRSVIIWKIRSGAYARIGTATTRSDGSYRLARARHRGYYYAKSPRVVAAGVAECKAVVSATFRIR